MNKLKELWQYSFFRWCVFVLPHFILLVFLIISINMNWFEFGRNGHNNKSIMPIAITVLITFYINFLVSPLYIWRKQIKKIWQWQYATFRWCVYGGIPLLFWTLAGVGAFSRRWGDDSAFEFGRDNLVSEGMGILLWFIIFIISILLVWRKPIFGFLNKKADEG